MLRKNILDSLKQCRHGWTEADGTVHPPGTCLRVVYERIDDAEVAELAQHLPTGLTSLNLARNSIGAEGAKALAQHLPTGLTSLNLGFNSIGAEGAKALFGQLDRLLVLKTIDLQDNEIGLPESVVDKNMNNPRALRDLWRQQSQAREEGKYLLAAKGVILGNGGGGKTMLTRWLAWWNANQDRTAKERQGDKGRPDPKASSPATHAFEQLSYPVPITIDGVARDLDLNIYDFGGQVEIHSAHRFFMAAKRNIFVILVSRAHADGQAPPRPGAIQSEEGRKLEYYLRMASHYGRSEGRGPNGKATTIYQPVIVVVGWADQKEQPNGPDWQDEADLRKIHPNTRVVHGYANAIDRTTQAAMGIDGVARAIREAVNSDVIVTQVTSEGEIAAVRKAREGIRAKMASPGGFVRALINPLDTVDPEQTPTLPWYPKLFTEAERSKPASPGGESSGTSQHEAAVLILRDIGMIHYVGDVATELRRRAEDQDEHERGRGQGSSLATEAGRAGEKLRNLFFCPQRIKHGVYHVIRSPDPAATSELLGTLTDRNSATGSGRTARTLPSTPACPRKTRTM